jgi:DNA primase
MTAQTEQFQRELDLSLITQEYLKERSFNLDTIKKFCVGFCPASSSYNFNLLNGRLVLPIQDSYNNEIAYAGRRMDSYSSQVKDFYQLKTNKFVGLEKFLKWKQSKWINSPYKKSDHLFNLNRAKKKIYENNLCIIVEGYFDVMFLDQMGFENVVALCGTSLSEKQCDLIFRYCDSVVIILDGDDAGKKATINSVHKARNNGLFAHVVGLNENTDPDDLTFEQINFVIEEIKKTQEELYITL